MIEIDSDEWRRIEAIFKHHQDASLKAFRKVLTQSPRVQLQMILTLMEGMPIDTDALESLTPIEYGLFESVIELGAEWHMNWNIDRGEEQP